MTEVGEVAPEFTLKNQEGVEVSLASLRAAGPVLIVFFPFAFSGYCTRELCEIRDDLHADAHGRGVTVVAVSCNHHMANRAFAESEKYEFDILSDFWPHGAVARLYGVFNEEAGAARRASFLVDGDGVVRWKVDNPSSQVREFAEHQAALEEITAG